MLAVFDLDFTLWDCGGVWCALTNPPYKRVNGFITDSDQRVIELYPDTKKILEKLKSENIPIAIASRTSEPGWARSLLELFEIEHFFTYQEIYPSSKTVHFKALQKQSGISFPEMYFFDDEYRNIEDVSALGVHCLHVRSGIDISSVMNLLKF